MLRAATVMIVALCVGCIGDDTGTNPPPERVVATISAAPALRAAPAAPTVAAPPAGRPTVFDPAPEVVRAPTPGSGEARQLVAYDRRDADRTKRIGAQDVVVLSLLDALDKATVTAPRLQLNSTPVVKQGTRAYQNPWVWHPNARHDQRMIWSDGKTTQWALRSALALPAPGTAEWTLAVPPRGRLQFGIAVGSIAGEVPVEITVVDQGETVAIWTESVKCKRSHKLKVWSEHEVDLSRWAGKEIRLRITATAVESTATVFMAEPVIVTNTADESGRTAAREVTGLDVADNVLLIVVDAQRSDTIGQPARDRKLPKLFPTMEKLVDDGVSFTRAYSVGNQTRLSTFAFLSSQYPTYGRYHLVKWNYSDQQKRAFYDADPPLAARLFRKLGYRTVGVANNLFLFGNMKLSLDGGFDRLIDHRHMTEDTGWITDSAVKWLTGNKIKLRDVCCVSSSTKNWPER